MRVAESGYVELSPRAGVEIPIEKAEKSAWSEIEQHLTQMNPYDFKNVVAGLLRDMGYYGFGFPLQDPTEASMSLHTLILSK
jgi:hypothetical protein